MPLPWWPWAAGSCTWWRRTPPKGSRRFARAARLAQRAGSHGLVAEALRDLAYVEDTSGRVAATRRLLSSAAAAAGDDAHAMSSVRAVEGMFLADRGAAARCGP